MPIEKEDLYNELLYEQIAILKSYKPNMGVPYVSHLSIRSKYYLKNRCKFFTSNRYKMLNRSISFQDYQKTNPKDDIDYTVSIDLNKFSELEKNVFLTLMDGGGSKRKICRELKITNYTFIKTVKSIQKKIS